MSFVALPQFASNDNPGSRIESEECDCPLCGYPDWTHLIDGLDNSAIGEGLKFSVVRCGDCGTCYTNPRPTLRSIEQFYPAAYRPHRTPKPPRRPNGPLRSLKYWCPPHEERKILRCHGEMRLLDFGCGGGLFLERMHQQGWRVTGIDISASAVETIRTKLGLRAIVGTFPHSQLRPHSYDLITMWHSLEHVHNPRDVVESAYSLLAPGGKLLIAVPNIESVAFRWFGSAWYPLDLPRHLTHFSPHSLTAMLQQARFHVDHIYTTYHAVLLRYSARLIGPRRGRNPWQSWLRMKAISRAAAWYTRLIGRADCLLASATRPG